MQGLTGWQRIDDGSLTATSFIHPDLTPGRKYHYIVAGLDGNGVYGTWSQQTSAVVSAAGTLPLTATPTATQLVTSTPTPTATAAAAALSAPALQAEAGAGQITLTWEEVANADSYYLIYYDWATSDWRQIGGVLTGAPYTHRGLTAGTIYHYLIQAVGANGAVSGWSNYAKAIPSETQTPTPTPTSTPSPTATAGDISETNPAEERAALVALYNATDGPNWARSHNWLTNEPLSTWSDVITDDNGHVTRLLLANNRLSGPLPDLSALSNLTTLNLSANQLSAANPRSERTFLPDEPEPRLQPVERADPRPERSLLPE